MACNCKKRYEEIEPYSDEHIPGQTEEKDNFFTKFFAFLIGLPFGILCAVLIIIMAVPVTLYVAVCTIFGVQPSFKLKLPRRKKKE